MENKIFFWDALRLAQALRQDQVREIGILKYFIIFSILFSGVASLPFGINIAADTRYPLLLAVFDLIAHAVIIYYGTWYVFQVNSKGDGVSFFRRFFALTLPISIRLLAIAFGVSVALFLVVAAFTVIWPFSPEYLILVWGGLFAIGRIFWALVFYWLMGRYIAIASGSPAS